MVQLFIYCPTGPLVFTGLGMDLEVFDQVTFGSNAFAARHAITVLSGREGTLLLSSQTSNLCLRFIERFNQEALPHLGFA